jgi:1,4-alpha-glucan branching enzyme
MRDSLITPDDIYFFKEGTHYKLYDKLGSHRVNFGGVDGYFFALWAPNAKYVSLISDFNNWDRGLNPMTLRDDNSGIWECFVPNIPDNTNYKYYIESHHHNQIFEKSDPYARFWETPPHSSSKTYQLNYNWNDKDWMDSKRAEVNSIDKPISIYEVHLGSWIKCDKGNFVNYRVLADRLANYIKELGFTHIELLPITEHPFYGSWGYQCIGYFAPTSRYGTPEDFMYFIDTMHKNGIGVILDWVPSHFAVDLHGLANFDGTNLYEHTDPRLGFHPEWGSSIFNFGRNEVREFLISSAMFWFDKYHIDGIRVDAVASILYLDYAREDGEWIPNKYGSNENLDAIRFLQDLNSTVYNNFDNILMIAEESTAWPNVSRPPYDGGLGFSLKWNMGWMHDSLKYFSKDSIYRKYHHDQITFSIWYAFHENFMLSLSHDEVVHMKGSLINKMSGDYWQKFANLRTLYSYMYAHPGKKLIFMGCEIAQFREWDYNSSIDWNLLDYEAHSKLQNLVCELNRIYKEEEALYRFDFDERGFVWVDASNGEQSILTFLRKGEKSTMLIICNFTPVVRYNYEIGVPFAGEWEEILNSDLDEFGGSGVTNSKIQKTIDTPNHGFDNSIVLALPPLAVMYLKYDEVV